VLIKGGSFLEIAGAISAIAFDKTGTLTEGNPKVSEVITLHSTENQLISIARTLEERSTHPIGLAIIEYAKEKGIASQLGESFQSIVGKGVQAAINDTTYYAGNLKMYEEMGTPINEIKKHVVTLQNEGNTLVIVGTKEMILGILAVSDTIRGTTINTVQKLWSTGVKKIIMLTGDNEGTAKKVASQANVNRYFAELLPEDKVTAIKNIQKEGHTVAMVGDGINDAPALAAADIGIAMGGAGTDTAMETADIVLMADNLEQLPHTIKLCRFALRIIKQNIWFSLIVKFAALILIFPGWLTLWIAVLSDTGAALIVILNSMRLLRLKT
jgi:Cd2+/Zn2+-exporting ATPase